MLRTKNFIEKPNLIKYRNYFANRSILRNIRSNFFTNLKYNRNSKKEKIVFFPNNGKISFELLNVFYTLIVCGNVTLASERLSISQPAISLSINKLEKKTGILLFQQLNFKKLIKLTPSGLILFNYIQRLFQIIQESIEISNLNYFYTVEQNLQIYNLSKHNQNNSKVLYLLNRNKKFLYSENKLLSFNTFPFSLRNLPSIKNENLKYFETRSKFLFIKTKDNGSQQLSLNFLFAQTKINSKKLDVEKMIPINLLNSNFSLYLKGNSLIEVNTAKAFNLCLKLEISDLIYWGSEL
jgi:hypothetical protein